MPKYLMFDHGGVLDGAVVTDNTQITANDVVLQNYNQIGSQVLTNGYKIINIIQQLVSFYNYKIVFHSTNSEHDQLSLLSKLRFALSKKKLQFPLVHAMAVYNDQLDCSSNAPQIKNVHGIAIASWGNSDNADGKASLRRSLESVLAIQPQERKHHIVFDDGRTIIKAAKKEGYQTYLIGNNKPALELEHALRLVLNAERRALYCADPFAVLKYDLINKIDDYLIWRNNKDMDDGRGYRLGLFSKLFHYTAFGEVRALSLRNKLKNASSDTFILVVQQHLAHDSRLRDHSLDTYLLEAMLQYKGLLNINKQFNLRQQEQRTAFRELIKQYQKQAPSPSVDLHLA